MNFGQWLGFISLIISLYILWQISQLLLLVFTAIILATALNRLVRILQNQFNLKRSLSIVIVLSSSLLLSIIAILVIVPPFIEQFQELLQLLPQGWETVRYQLNSLQEKNLDWLPPLPSVNELITQLQPLTAKIFENFLAFFSNSVTAILQLLLILVLMMMMLANPLAYRSAFLQLFPSFYRRRADEILNKSEQALANWLTGIVINCIFIGTLSGIGLWILQIDLVLVHALIAGLFNFIPNIGPASSVIFPVMIALLDQPWKIIAILIWYFIIQNIESYWLTPTVMAKQVSLLPAVTLISQLFFAKFLGLFGLILALPLTVVAKTWIEEVLFHDILDQWEFKTFTPSPPLTEEFIIKPQNTELDHSPPITEEDKETR